MWAKIGQGQDFRLSFSQGRWESPQAGTAYGACQQPPLALTTVIPPVCVESKLCSDRGRYFSYNPTFCYASPRWGEVNAVQGMPRRSLGGFASLCVNTFKGLNSFTSPCQPTRGEWCIQMQLTLCIDCSCHFYSLHHAVTSPCHLCA